jgi:hypothetical protein
MDTNKDLEQAANSAPTSTPMKGQQAFQKTNLTIDPSYYPEDHLPLQLPSSLELESESSKRAVVKFHNEKAEAKLKHAGKARTIADQALKSRSQRQDNRW